MLRRAKQPFRVSYASWIFAVSLLGKRGGVLDVPPLDAKHLEVVEQVCKLHPKWMRKHVGFLP
jgi:hypothetical protein